MALQLPDGTNCRQFAQLLSPSGLPWYFSAVTQSIVGRSIGRPESHL